MISALIDKQDGFELVRGQIAAILATESARQVVLATAASKPVPADWKLRVYEERSNPFEAFLVDNPVDTSPIVSVWWDTAAFAESAGSVVDAQQADGVFNVDCYGYGVSEDVTAGGHIPGDLAAANAAHRAVRLVRNILMAAEYTYLGLRGTVGKRWISSITPFQPSMDEQPIQGIMGARLSLGVRFNEYAPQVEGNTLERVVATVRRAEDGEIVVVRDYDYTT